LAHSFGLARNEEELAISDMITIAFYYLLCPGEYSSKTSDDAAFLLEDVALFVQDR
jgi:hypothetical protein